MNEQHPHDWPYCHDVKLRVDASDSAKDAQELVAAADKALYWFDTLVQCARLLGLSDDEPIPSGVLRAVKELTAATNAQSDSGSVDTPVLREILHDLCALWIGDNSEPKARLIAHIESLIAGVRKDAERWRFMMRVADDDQGLEAQAMERLGNEPMDDGRPESEQMNDLVDAAIRVLIHSPATSSKDGVGS